MTTDINFDAITSNAKGWERYFEQAKTDPYAEKDRISKAFGMVKSKAYGIIKSRIERAIETSPVSGESEFSRGPLKEPLLAAFLDDEMVKVDSSGYVYLDTALAGDHADLMDGINSAREFLKSFNKTDKQMSPAQKSAFWRKVVYPSYSEGVETDDIDLNADTEDAEEIGDLWTRTIAARFSFWQGMAPYWYFLEHGNMEESESGGVPFPSNRPTNFVYKIEQELNRLMDLSLLEVDSMESNVIDDTLTDFANDPENHQPYDILEEFYKDSRKYYVYITPTRQVGVALETSYRRMYGR